MKTKIGDDLTKNLIPWEHLHAAYMEITVCYVADMRARNACKRSNKIWKKRGTMSLQIISSVALLHIFHSQFVRHFPDFQLQSLCAFETLKVLKIW